MLIWSDLECSHVGSSGKIVAHVLASHGAQCNQTIVSSWMISRFVTDVVIADLPTTAENEQGSRNIASEAKEVPKESGPLTQRTTSRHLPLLTREDAAFMDPPPDKDQSPQRENNSEHRHAASPPSPPDKQQSHLGFRDAGSLMQP
ncbi:hypothetical protein L484_020547 [Morus notabilis]|uniref:Uncharacterized protein n=1 Tax=Morus notabilis TaxID=981085 RepID=W9SBB8_9ROSA|nr:hypothetical protein L484_020547 [Morus notabilis]